MHLNECMVVPCRCVTGYCGVGRSADLPVQHRNKRQFTHPIAVIRGKKEPKRMDCYLQRFMADAVKCGPKGGKAVSKLAHT